MDIRKILRYIIFTPFFIPLKAFFWFMEEEVEVSWDKFKKTYNLI